MTRNILAVKRLLWTVSALAVLSACGGGSASGPTYSVGGTVSGLVGSGLQLSDNGGAALAVSGNGFFTIATSVAPGAAYSISVVTQPQNPPQTCVVHNGSGTMGSGPVSGVTVVCATDTFTVGGTVSGLQGAGLVLQNNGTDNLAVTQSGPITFSTPIAVGSPYAVTVSTQPSAPVQTCTIANGSGMMGTANVTNVAVTCTNNFPAIYTVSVTVSGWSGSPMVLQLNGASPLSVSANGSATFATKLSSTAPYNVTVQSQPAGSPPQTCTVTNGSGVIATGNITNVVVTCVADYSVGVTVGGLASTLTLLLNGADPVSISANGNPNATFSTLVPSGASYAVTVGKQPTVPSQTCTVVNGTGTMGTANVTNVSVVCSALVYAASVKGDWTLMTALSPSYGTEGVPSPLNYPQSRSDASSWTDKSGNLWLFGGTFFLCNLDSSYCSDNVLWKYTPSTGIWVWVDGSQSGAAVYGTKGTPSANNIPAPTDGANSWVDPNTGNLWLFAGDGGNDLWEFNPSAATWEWVGGSAGTAVVGVYGSQGVAAAGNAPGSRSQAAGWIDAAGNLWVFGGSVVVTSTPPYSSGNDLWEYSRSTGLWTWVSGSVAGTNNGDITDTGSGPVGIYGTQGTASSANVPGGRSAAVSWRDAAGNLWLFGGLGVDSTGDFGQLNDLWKYSPGAGTWEWVGGSDRVKSAGVYGTQGVPSSANIPGARYNAMSWVDSAGNFWLFGGVGDTSLEALGLSGYESTDDLWEFSPTAGTWTWVNGSYAVEKPTVYGIPDVPAPSNSPGGRELAAPWTDAGGNLWLFGGDNGNGAPAYDDFWVYTPLVQ
jgi:hypothetical protein